MEETTRALKEMGSWKDPGPDGYQPGFFQKDLGYYGIKCA